MAPVKRTWVTFFYPGSLLEEAASQPVETRDVERLTIPEGAFAFQFFDRTDGVLELDGDLIEVTGKPKNHSPRYYPDGEVLTLADVAPGSYLEQNMRGNGWDRVVRTRRGNVQLLDDGAVILHKPSGQPGGVGP